MNKKTNKLLFRDFVKLVNSFDGDGKGPVHLALECRYYARVEFMLDDFYAGKYAAKD